MAAFAGLSAAGKSAYLAKDRNQLFCFKCEVAVNRRLFKKNHTHTNDISQSTAGEANSMIANRVTVNQTTVSQQTTGGQTSVGRVPVEDGRGKESNPSAHNSRKRQHDESNQVRIYVCQFCP